MTHCPAIQSVKKIQCINHLQGKLHDVHFKVSQNICNCSARFYCVPICAFKQKTYLDDRRVVGAGVGADTGAAGSAVV